MLYFKGICAVVITERGVREAAVKTATREPANDLLDPGWVELTAKNLINSSGHSGKH